MIKDRLRNEGWVHNPVLIEEMVTNGRGFINPEWMWPGFDALFVQIHLGNRDYLSFGSEAVRNGLTVLADVILAAHKFNARVEGYYVTPTDVIDDVRATLRSQEDIPDGRVAAEGVVLRRMLMTKSYVSRSSVLARRRL